MHRDPSDRELLHHLMTDLEDSEWRASLPQSIWATVCVRMELRTAEPRSNPFHAVEFCRRTLADAVSSARKHVGMHS